METYKIPGQTLWVVPNIFKVSFSGRVTVDFPKANVQIPAKATGCSDYTYKISLDPEKGRWSDEDTHKWSLANYPVTVRLSIDKDAPRYVKAEVLGHATGKKKRKVLWHDTFDIYDPYKKRKVEMFAQPAFIEPIKSNADHTYAVGYGDDGKRNYLWPCGGDHDENQRSLGTGEAFQPECDCLSQMRSDPITHGLAGIRYGLDGVCHQATNRIMCTAGLEVTNAKGYKSKGWKYLTYTLYGRLGLKAIDGIGLITWLNICKGCLTKQYSYCMKEDVLLTDPDDHEGLTQTHVDNIAPKVEQTRKDLLSIYEQLKGGKITPLEYSNGINATINNYKNSMVDVLGQPLYREIFSELAEQEVVVAVPQIAERVFANGVPDDSGH